MDCTRTLHAIDAAVDQLCACGCGRQLDAAGPSAYFAGPECQQRWHEAQTTNPREVLNRHDAAPYPQYDQERVELLNTVPREARVGFTLSPEAVEQLMRSLSARGVEVGDVGLAAHAVATAAPRTDWETDLRAIEHALGYRRLCPDCGRRLPPRIERDEPEEVYTFGRSCPIRLVPGPAIQVCAHCASVWPGPFLTSTIEIRESFYGLRLADGRHEVRRRITAEELTGEPDPRRYVDGVWQRMETELLRPADT